MSTPAPAPRLGVAWPLLGLAVAVKLALSLPVLTRYGWHRDELYELAAIHHLSWGYVDFPWALPAVGHGIVAVFGDSLFALRATALLAGSATLAVICLLTRELGGGARAQGLGLAAMTLSPGLLGENALFQPNSLDILAWSVVFWLALRLRRDPTPARWSALALAAGLGLDVKWSLAVLLLSLGVGLALTRQAPPLRTRGPLLALGLLAVLLAPTVWWEARHGWPTLTFFSSQNAVTRQDESRIEFVLHQLLLVGPLVMPLVVFGGWRLWSYPKWRWLAIACVLPVLAFAASGGRAYYAFPAYGPLLAAGAIGIERLRARPRAVLIGLALAAPTSTLAFLPVVLPVRSARDMASGRLYDTRADYGDEIGWPELSVGAARAARRIHATAILAANYGEAGALERDRARLRMPPVLSGHLSFQYWRPPGVQSRRVLLVGFPAARARSLCSQTQLAGRISNALGVQNEEAGRTLTACTLRHALGRSWPRIATLRL